MGILRFLVGVIAIFIGFWLAVKLLAFLFALLGIVLSLVKLAILVGLAALLGYGLYRLIFPAERRAS